ncbi:MAG: polysaccharide deacetylase family protein [Pseudomonadales bacterium]|jgi:predicted glycoside hydrolase/deacetylase ChbG (UPF0249 family)|nr:polysaccharide deacetylase family protein [Pseudomonadales bacterium]MDC0892842.1 polysaccharide deacetylase family protein [Pseudomonadales bacterium]MDC6450723.1 polysaccharide deacetylase family protein [Pseudomonadales bacterium]MDG1002140.1 polysaccharide deacetylase family protein [Pseudomonadales bacterium]MDG1303809.1 polysaccharide deacetylase family protein [Pseudomonadales bacterium]|tara:strand:+ start:1825 stop:2703 length:879 start_codon:yes stop_codon:yes gene_type:complete
MNEFLKKMGYDAGDKVLITHIDDIGFSHAANVASFECLDVGAASCGSIVTAGPWFQEAAEICRANPLYDVGVHLTLTCEYPTFRWPAVSSREPSSGLLDEQGYLWRTREDAVRHVTVAAAEQEMRAQIQMALDAGLEITHIDTHMGSVVHPKFLPAYLSLANEFGVPAFLPNITRERLAMIDKSDIADGYAEVLEKIDTNRVPTLDEIYIDTLRPLTDKKAFYREIIDKVGPGLNHLLFHPAKMSEELVAIDKERPESRHADYEAWRDPALKQYILDAGIHLIGYRELKQAL